MDRRMTALAALVLGAALVVPGAGGVAAQQEQDPTGPTRTGGLGEIIASLNAGPAADSATGSDGNVDGPNRDVAAIPDVGARPPGADTAIGIAPGAGSTIAGAPETATAPGALAPTVTETTTDPLGSVLGKVAPGEGRGNRGNSGADGTDSAEAGPGGSASGAPAEPAPAAEADPAPAGDDAAAPSGEAVAEPAEDPAAVPAEGACGYPTWLAAQLALEADASLAGTLDPDNDGIACEAAMD